MRYLYVDNFRGFTDTYIPITEVNYFVGENSTGKSSLLGLIKLLSSPDFWIRNRFDTDEVQFGNFSDIVSVNSKDKSYFSIGLIKELKSEETGERELSTFVLTFVEREGIPSVALYVYAREGKEYRIRIGKKQIKYKSSDINSKCDANEFIESSFKKWTKAYHEDTKGYKVAPENIITRSNVPPVFIASSIEEIINQDKKVEFASSAIIPAFSDEIAWLAPIRSKPRRTYDEYRLDFSPEGEHTPYIIKKLLDRKTDAEKFKDFMSNIGVDSGLFESIRIKKYGTGVTSPFELDVVLNSKQLSISNVGYGVSQALPIIVELFVRQKGSWYAVQQPEVHLHPKAQAALGDAFYQLAAIEKKKFIIETHSDYTIDRFRTNYKSQEQERKPKAQVLFFERTGEGNMVTSLSIDENGELPIDQPKSYREFFIKEELMNLGI
jgi:hypothetical protein